ncbi:Pex19 protein family-domain-containing protein [Aspergillus ambiguus]|uniref:putative peroxisomal membrane protein receptor Pex19 n=1 Tax=Aspergillus ambiguus TaxID=176160 RepID=UPI003CCDB76C
MSSATPDPQPNNPAPTTTTTTEPTASPPSQQPSAQKVTKADDSDSDFDELDDVLDNFKPKAPSAPAPASASASTPKPDAPPAPPTNTTADDGFDEEAFMRQLEKDMASMMDQAAQESGTTDNRAFENAINEHADAFAKQLEEGGVAPGDFLKQLMGSAMLDGAQRPAGADEAGPSTGAETNAPPAESFNDAIQRTINRIKESGDKTTEEVTGDDVSDDLVAQLLKAVEAGASAGDDGDLTKMFMGMMEQLSNKDMLYEPMKELHGKFGPWIAANKGSEKVSAEDMARYESQAEIVSQIVTKFEEPGYTDEDPKCREYVWEKMQEMQAAGNPPEELVANPWTDDMSTPPGMPDCPQQ